MTSIRIAPRTIVTSALAPVFLLAACSSEPAWRDLDPQALTSSQRGQLEKAKRACKALGEGLKGRLTTAINKDGPAKSIDVCRVAAAEITAAICEREELRIGRTSHRLRNPANTPPDWAAATVRKAESKVTLRAGPENQLGALLPIPTAGLCVTCHGDEASIPAAVRDALQQHYPKDQATGFAPDQLRGWFWVEVPPK